MLKKLICMLCLGLLLTGCQAEKADPTAAQTTQIFAMDTVMDLSVYSEDSSLLSQAESLITELERSFSTTDPKSEIYELNSCGSADLSESTAELLQQALGFCDKTGGILDLSIYPVVRAWGFTTGSYQVPAQEELDALLSHVDYTKIDVSPDSRHVTLPQGMEIDLGSVAKGYTSDRLTQLFREHGAASALLNLGGNVQALGARPDGSPWRIGIQDPLGESYLGVLEIEDEAVITSGGYERYFEDEAGNLYWHIIDPATGYPARNGLISSTAVGPEGVYCDALSTSLFIMGPEQAIAFWQEQQDFDMILVTDDGSILITPDLQSRFRLVDGVSYHLMVIPEA